MTLLKPLKGKMQVLEYFIDMSNTFWYKVTSMTCYPKDDRCLFMNKMRCPEENADLYPCRKQPFKFRFRSKTRSSLFLLRLWHWNTGFMNLKSEAWFRAYSEAKLSFSSGLLMIENNSWLCTWVLAQLWSGLELESPRPLSPQRYLAPTTLRTGRKETS